MSDKHLLISQLWAEKAGENLNEWGQQDVETLLLAAQEELGELTQATLQAKHEGGSSEDVRAELNDLAALMYQIQWALDDEEARF